MEARSSEYEDAPSQRPRLTVDYVPPCDRGDGNRDGLVDLAELAALIACITGPLGPIDPPRYLDYCGCFDADADGDIDIADFAMFQTVFSDEG